MNSCLRNIYFLIFLAAVILLQWPDRHDIRHYFLDEINVTRVHEINYQLQGVLLSDRNSTRRCASRLKPWLTERQLEHFQQDHFAKTSLLIPLYQSCSDLETGSYLNQTLSHSSSKSNLLNEITLNIQAQLKLFHSLYEQFKICHFHPSGSNCRKLHSDYQKFILFKIKP